MSVSTLPSPAAPSRRAGPNAPPFGLPPWFVDTDHAFGGDALGLDVSRFQRAVPWDAVQAAGYAYAHAKATDGTAGVDAEWIDNCAALLTHPRLRGSAYWFFQPSLDPHLQARHFANLLPADLYGPRSIGPMVDIETAGGLRGEALRQAIRAAVFATEDRLGRMAVVYMGGPFYNEHVGLIDDLDLAQRPLMLPAYTGGPSPRVLPHPWRDVGASFWQYDGDGGLVLPNGVDADFSLFAGDAESLDRFCPQLAGQPGGT